MITFAVFLVIVAAALFQVSVAPLFPVGGAIADVTLLALFALAFTAGPRRTMIAMPLLALFVAFTSNRAPGLLIVAYLPLLPLAYLFEGGHLPLSRYLRILAAILLAGLWARTVLSTGAFIEGAPFAPGALIGDVLVPGLLLDAVFATMVYLPFRALGWTNRPLTLQRTGWH